MSGNDPKDKPAPPATPAAEENPIIAADKAEAERKALIEVVRKLEQENSILESKIRQGSKERAQELRQDNDKLKAEFAQVEAELFELLAKQKIPLDAGSISIKLESVKRAAIDYCTERNLDPELWKNLESL